MEDVRRFDGIPFNNQKDAPKAAAIGEESVSEKPVEVIKLLNEKLYFIVEFFQQNFISRKFKSTWKISALSS